MKGNPQVIDYYYPERYVFNGKYHLHLEIKERIFNTPDCQHFIELLKDILTSRLSIQVWAVPWEEDRRVEIEGYTDEVKDVPLLLKVTELYADITVEGELLPEFKIVYEDREHEYMPEYRWPMTHVFLK